MFEGMPEGCSKQKNLKIEIFEFVSFLPIFQLVNIGFERQQARCKPP